MNNKSKKILYVTGTRADFGLMAPILKSIDKSKKLDLSLYATGMHLMPKFGKTINLVRKEFRQVKIINAIFNNNTIGTLDFLSNFFDKIGIVMKKESPDFVLLLGDRPEMLALATACVYMGIPTGHIHGGEVSSTHDELARHAITKLASVHFPATQQSCERIKKMGEESWRINVVGAPALDSILKEKLASRKELFSYLKRDVKEKVILLTLHPTSDNWQDSGIYARKTINVLKKFKLPIIAIYPNTDLGSEEIIQEYKKEKNNRLFQVYPNIDYKLFLALEREAEVWVGNSSAAMIESASFKTPVVNIGTRQHGRQRGENVISTNCSAKEIERAVRKSLFDKRYIKKLQKIKNPYGSGNSGVKIQRILEKLEINSRLVNKKITY